MGPTITILKPGLLTTVQDQGRTGVADLAISQGGALDSAALALANRMVCNHEAAAGLEITGVGPTLYFPQETAIAWCGAAVDALLDGVLHTVPESAALASESQQGDQAPLSVRLFSHRPIVLPAGSTVRWPAIRKGFRAWIACAGGIDSPVILGSRSSHLAAGIGPAPLKAGDQLRLGPDAQDNTEAVKLMINRQNETPSKRSDGSNQSGCRVLQASWSVPVQLPFGWPRLEIPVMTGRHFGALSVQAQDALFHQAFQVSPQSNRQGLQLLGRVISTEGLPEIQSEAVRAGTVQLPQRGEPLLLLTEHQTVGGYPRILEAISTAASALSQAGPGTEICFRKVSLEDALHARQNADRQQLALHGAIAAKFA
jgi:antagonist of KipI